MRNLLLKKIRLSTYFWIFFLVYLYASVLIPGRDFAAGALTLFSVNSFLYGFYIAPILGAQKARIEELHKIIRSEANAIFALVLYLKKLPKEMRNELQDMVSRYLRMRLKYKTATAGEKEYEALITYCIDYKGANSDIIDKTLNSLVANQQNRTNFSMQTENKVFANEWHIMAILFSITLGFILSINIADLPILHVVRALLCTGLTMLLVIVIKLSTLTHKKANQMWLPLKKLVGTNFYRID